MPGGDRSFAHGGGFRKDALGVDLVAPLAMLVDAPARWRKREPVHGAATPAPERTPATGPAGDQRPDFNLLEKTCP